ncbi:MULTISPECIES: exodeoxyribonuclease VII large subunit [unclassified Fusibacter]|uniref:exodeoxyribonuclease VII large subunit n=1 Tax=unclassified Fusibacter TaxID=2624464 RepID=UPI0013E9727D|nr:MULTISPECIES: exodeoxyribonuclease VII large subunit [unclassified Fusibacter]MCK8058885.1 exodeoxyribonuclease VII large subunit [Fusibacter sp. A2]NPE21960.1 exodeoxyribonuclease VII large subunit [Fusibacter sp. A1]
MRIKTYSVSEINRYINRLLEGDPILNALSVRGEISNFKLHSSGHAYFNLKDETGKIPCVMFKSSFDHVLFSPTEGSSVIARGHITVYEREGRYQLLIHSLEEEGAGDLHMRFLKLKETLKTEGYFEESRKQPIENVTRVGVVTSATGAALQDFLSVLRRRNPMVEVVVYPSAVQGSDAPYSIAEGIVYFNKKKSVDAIVITRGGGSIEELWAFNERVVADAIFDSRLPVMSAVGHEVDFTIADFVADRRAPTPTAAAELISESKATLKRQLDEAKNTLGKSLKSRLNEAKLNLSIHQPQRLGRALTNHINQLKLSLDNDYDRHVQKMTNRLVDARRDVESIAGTLRYQNPNSVLEKGYAIIKDHHKVIDTIESLSLNKIVTVVMKDGHRQAKVVKEESDE